MDLLSPQIILLTLSMGSLAGFLAGLLGIGGGVILVPLFLWLFPLAGFDPEVIVHTAFGTSLAIILPTAIGSTLAHRKNGNVVWPMVWYLALGGILGSFLGSSAASVIPGEMLKVYFGLMQILVSLKLLFYKTHVRLEDEAPVKNSSLVLVGLIGGFFSAFFGIGGGVIAVPLMLIFLHLPIHKAVGNSAALIVVSSFSAVICYIWYGLQLPQGTPFSFGYVNLLVAALVAPLSIFSARVGVKFASRTSQTKLVKIFAVLLMCIGIKILLKL
ncbi:sulfite exporter TauE/SafE family protein [uncultured Desulfuromusa sp.]|uniref:sulfite exporter TauE/SafE family protein n=1 Tax=uncultured Desulfuromusa sp. TaxID=219183 RepID=UPI002AA8D7F2|nr:sulfite exporter TauE/SafE family protein [uncultured Desulfuromusa sp.]